MLVVDARDIGLGRLLPVEPDVLDRALAGPGAIMCYSALAGDSECPRSASVGEPNCLWMWLGLEVQACAIGNECKKAPIDGRAPKCAFQNWRMQPTKD